MDAKTIRRHNLTILISEAGGQKKLAGRTGVNPAYLSQILSRKTLRTMGDDVARRLERGMSKPHGWMDVMHEYGYSFSASASGVGGAVAAREVDDVRARYGGAGFSGPPPIAARVPLISWVAAGRWGEVASSFQPEDASAWVDTTKRIGPTAFALRVHGDSMEPKCPEGSIIVVDPDREAVNGSLVVVRLDEDDAATFKKLVVEGGRRYLAPLNPRYPVLEINGPATICGVVRQILIDLD
ncbi:MAG: S24 family peptidase [Nitrospirota bacterium]|nr:S24 family peptidase [Nitrospirota bacterium]